jgi:hypothetical protein
MLQSLRQIGSADGEGRRRGTSQYVNRRSCGPFGGCYAAARPWRPSVLGVGTPTNARPCQSVPSGKFDSQGRRMRTEIRQGRPRLRSSRPNMGGFVLRPRGKGTSCYKYELETKSAGKRVCELGALADNEKYKPATWSPDPYGYQDLVSPGRPKT